MQLSYALAARNAAYHDSVIFALLWRRSLTSLPNSGQGSVSSRFVKPQLDCHPCWSLVVTDFYRFVSHSSPSIFTRHAGNSARRRTPDISESSSEKSESSFCMMHADGPQNSMNTVLQEVRHVSFNHCWLCPLLLECALPYTGRNICHFKQVNVNLEDERPITPHSTAHRNDFVISLLPRGATRSCIMETPSTDVRDFV